MLNGRLGLDDTRVPQKSRNGLVYVERARVAVETGSLGLVARCRAPLLGTQDCNTGYPCTRRDEPDVGFGAAAKSLLTLHAQG